MRGFAFTVARLRYQGFRFSSFPRQRESSKLLKRLDTRFHGDDDTQFMNESPGYNALSSHTRMAQDKPNHASFMKTDRMQLKKQIIIKSTILVLPLSAPMTLALFNALLSSVTYGFRL